MVVVSLAIQKVGIQVGTRVRAGWIAAHRLVGEGVMAKPVLIAILVFLFFTVIGEVGA